MTGAENVAPNALEEVPIDQLKSAFTVSETPDGPEVDPDASLPLAARLTASKPMTRRDAYNELSGLFAEAEAEAALFTEHAPVVKKLLADTMSLCHDGALSAASAFALRAPLGVVGEEAAAIASCVVEKHLAGKLQSKALDVVLALVESRCTAQVQAALLKGCAHKVPKTCCAAAKALVEVCRAFGAVFDMKALSAVPATLLQHREKGVRDEAASLVLELRRARGDVCLKDMKGLPEDKAAALLAAPLPEGEVTRWFRTASGERGGPAASGGDAAATPAAASAAAAAVVEEYDLLANLPRSKGSATPDKWLKLLAEPKWKERQGAVELLVQLAEGRPKLAAADYSEVARALKALLADANVCVVASAARAVGALAAPLGREFREHARKAGGALLEKGADKDRRVLDAVHATLRGFTAAGCLTPAEALEVSGGALGAANPKVKLTALAWLCTVAPSLKKADAKPFQDAAASLTDDGAAEVRKGAFDLLAAVHQAVGADAEALLAALPLKKAQRLRELAGGEAAPASSAPPTPRAELPPPASARAAGGAAIRRGAPAAAPPPVAARVASGAKGGGAKGAEAARGGKAEEWVEPELPAAEELAASTQADGVLTPAVREQLADKVWGTRAAALASIGAAVREMDAADRTAELAEVVVWELCKPTEKHMQVQNAQLETLSVVAAECDLLARRSARRMLPLAIEKLGVKQNRQAAADALYAVGEACGPSWVFSQLHSLAQAQKNPKVLSEALGWAAEALVAFGVPAISPSEPIALAIAAAEHRDAAVRLAAVRLLVAVRRAVGARLLDSPLLKDLKEAARKQLEAESATLGEAPELPPPTRAFKHAAAAASAKRPAASSAAACGAKKGNAESAASAAVLDDLLPRVDLMEVLKPEVVKKLKDPNWKERQAALQAVLLALKETPRATPGVGALIEGLRPRLKDHQVVLSTMAINALGLLAQAVGKTIRMHLKAAVPDLMGCVGDSKQQVRDAAMEALERWVAEVSFEPFVPLMPRALAAMEAPVGRAKLLEWLAAYLPAVSASEEKQLLLPPLLKNLDDRNSEVRAASQAALAAALAAGVPPAAVDAALGNLNRATLSKLRPVVDKLFADSPHAAAAAAAAAGGAAPLPAPKPSATPRTHRPEAAAAARPRLLSSSLPGPSGALSARASHGGALSSASRLAYKPKPPPATARAAPRPAPPPAAAPAAAAAVGAEEREVAARLAALEVAADGAEVSEAIALLRARLADAAGAAALADAAPALCAAVCARVQSSFSPKEVGQCKQALDLMLDAFGVGVIMQRLGEPEIRQLISLLLARLVDCTLNKFAKSDAQTLLQTFNVLMLKLLQYAPRERTLCVLLGLLAQPVAPSEDIYKLLIKCISKLTTNLGAVAAQLDVAPVLYSLHCLYTSAPQHKALHAADAMVRELVAHHGKRLLDLIDSRVPNSSPLVGRVHQLTSASEQIVAPLIEGLPAPPTAAPLAPPPADASPPPPRDPPNRHSPPPPEQPAEGSASPADATSASPPPPSITPPPAETSDAEPAEGTMAVALARLHEMRKRYNIPASQAASATEESSPSRQAADGAPADEEATLEVEAEQGRGDEPRSPESPSSPAPDVQAIRNRLARLKAAPRH